MSVRSAVPVVLLAWLAMPGFSFARERELEDREILKRADEARGNLEGVTWDVSVVSHDKRDEEQHLDLFVQARGFDVLAITSDPPRFKGNKLLLVRRNMWFHKKGLSKPVPISLRQKLVGLAAYGDIPATNYADDYTARRRPDENVGGEQCYVFDLKAKSKTRTTYDQIVYWISRSRLVALKADYYTVSGKRFKSSRMKYQNSVRTLKGPRPFISEILFADTLMSRGSTVMSFVNPSLKPIHRSVFDLNLLTK